MNLLITLGALLLSTPALVAQVNRDSAHAAHHPKKGAAEDFKIPSSLKAEHEELHNTLKTFTALPGRTGAAAQQVAEGLHPHFVKEEEFALPLLGLLPDLAKGNTTEQAAAAIAMAEKLKKNFPQMLSEHKQIVGLLDKLEEAARAEHHPEVLRFIESLKLHAQNEEEVLYPAAILVGAYLKRKA